MRLRRETYDWSGSGEVLQRNTQYVAHALKNDLNKIDWCAALLDERLPENRELQIIRGSVDHLRALLQRTRMHTGRVVLNPGDCDVRALFEQIIRETPHTDALRIEIDRCDDAPLYCDPSHVREALTNLVGNSVATIVVAKWEGALDMQRLHAELDQPTVIEEEPFLPDDGLLQPVPADK